MKRIYLIVTFALITHNLFAGSLAVDELRDTRGEKYKKLRDEKVTRLTTSPRITEGSNETTRVLTSILESHKKAPQTHTKLEEIIQASRQKRATLTAEERKKDVNPRSAQLFPRLLDFAGRRGGKFKTRDTQLALIESLWKFAQDDYEQLNFVLALSELTPLEEQCLPIIRSVLQEAKHPQVIKHTLLLLAKFDVTFSDVQVKEAIRSDIAAVLPACLGNEDCRQVCSVMLKKIGGTESMKLIETIKAHEKQEANDTKPLQKKQEEDIVVEVKEP